MLAVGLLVAVGFLVLDRSPANGAEAKDKAKAQAKEAVAAPAPPPAADEAGTITHTFQDDNQVQEFAALWQQRRQVLLRMAVLQSYWDQEQAGLAELNKHLAETYHVDPSKSYRLDTDRRALIEQPAAAAGQESPPAAPSP
jgi:hypothetical protein